MKVGGPVYRIGVGGGAASSVAVQGGDSRDHALDFGAVQRGESYKYSTEIPILSCNFYRLAFYSR